MTMTAEPTSETTEKPEHKYVGKPVTRVEGTGKVTGEALYAADIVLPDMLHAILVRSPHAHAAIRGIDTSRARQIDGVEHVITAADLPRFEAKRKSNRAYVILAEEETVFFGEPVAAVLARTPAIAEEAAALIRVDYEELPAVIDPVAAIADGSPLARKPVSDIDRSESQGHVTLKVDEQGAGKPSNISSQVKFSRGDVDQGFAEADIVIDRTWRSPYMHQGYIEPHATIADFDAASGELTIWTATQGQFFVRDQLAHMLKIRKSVSSARNWAAASAARSCSRRRSAPSSPSRRNARSSSSSRAATTCSARRRPAAPSSTSRPA